jgi:O-antigen ligase
MAPMSETIFMFANRRLPWLANPNSALLLSATLRQFLLLFFTILSISAYLTVVGGNHYVAPQASVLIVASALYFIFLCLTSITKRAYYWAALPLVLLTVPNAINDLFPSIYMGPPDASVAPPAFALFTHIDLFLLLGLLRYGRFSLSKQLLTAVFVALVTTFFVFVNYLTGAWSTDGIYGLYQLRYILLTYLVFREVRFGSARRPFVLGLIAAISLTLIETLLFTFLITLPGHLISGNLGKNPLGHFAAAALCFFIFYRPPKAVLLHKYLPLGIATLLMIGSGTRFSIIAALVSVLIVALLRSSTVMKSAAYCFVGMLAVLTILLTTPQGKSIVEGIAHVSGDISSPYLIERTPESSSIITRLEVWLKTADMARTHSVTGVGPGNWSFLKADFDIPYDGLLDPHNDLINFIVSYGIPSGLLFFAAVLFYPLIGGYRASFQRPDGFLQGCYAFILCITVTGLTNATLWKHQIFALTLIFSCLLIFNRERQIKQ